MWSVALSTITQIIHLPVESGKVANVVQHKELHIMKDKQDYDHTRA